MTGRAYDSETIALLYAINGLQQPASSQAIHALDERNRTIINRRLAGMTRRGLVRRDGPVGQSSYTVTERGHCALAARAQGATNLGGPARPYGPAAPRPVGRHRPGRPGPPGRIQGLPPANLPLPRAAPLPRSPRRDGRVCTAQPHGPAPALPGWAS